jgi:hypothetical protein
MNKSTKGDRHLAVLFSTNNISSKMLLRAQDCEVLFLKLRVSLVEEGFSVQM